MSICDGCIHDYVCGLEDNHEDGIVSCADRIPKDVFDKIRTEIEQLRIHKAQFLTSDNKVCIDSQAVLDIIDKYKAESEE